MATQGAYLAADDAAKKVGPPTMARSRGQLGAAYAPGAFFTFEGGLGACISIPDLSANVDEAPIDTATKAQIVLRLQEVWQSWFDRAYALGNNQRLIDPRQCLDEALLRGATVSPLSADRIAFLSPLRMGYAPAPLTFVCNRCNLFRRFESASKLAKEMQQLRNSKCTAHGATGPCQWRQLDVIFVHWSGEWMPATPGRWEWDDRRKELRLYGEECTVCNSKLFKLNSDSPRIGRWHFYCANPTCGHKGSDEWRQNDKFTTGIFQDRAGKRVSERRMEPISYRASSAFYAQSEQFVRFPRSEQQLLTLLEPHKQSELAAFIGTSFRFGGGPLTPEDMKAALLAAGKPSEWDSYENFAKIRDACRSKGDTVVAGLMEAELAKLVARWTSGEPPLVRPPVSLPASVNAQLSLRSEYTSRFDPFVLAVEHEALERGKLTVAPIGGRAPFVRFKHLDKDLAPKTAEAKAAQEAETAELMAKLGMAELGLIREFDLCRFTHGYTRVSPTPTMEKRNQFMPVRLRLFDPINNTKRPIYVVTQANEAIYVRLEPESVYRWLQAVGVTDLPEWDPNGTVRLGGRLLEVAHPFGRYFSELKAGDARTYRYVYTLLHTYAHVLMKNIAELSGLDLGSMGEYLFPLDLAFVVYRNGTTMDLGNISALWRNENNRYLRRLLDASSHRCNSGALCDAGGGACPDCIMIPETSCLAQNQLLSRAVLKGGPPPREDLTHKGQRIPGYLESVNATAVA